MAETNLSMIISLHPDYLTQLPDEILCAILSRLPIKEVVRTSVLSRRFRFVWTWVPCLNLDPGLMLPQLPLDQEMEPVTRVKRRLSLSGEALTWVLKNHQGPVTKIQIVHSVEDSMNALPKRWLRTISCWRLIQELSLISVPTKFHLGEMDLYEGIFHELDHLHSLELSNYYVDESSPFHGCTNIKRLTLHELDVSGSTLSSIISECPNLEILRMRKFCLIREIVVRLEKLECLEIFGVGLVFVDIDCPNLRELDLENFFCKRSAISKKKVSIRVPNVQNVRMCYYIEHEDGFFDDYNVNEEHEDEVDDMYSEVDEDEVDIESEDAYDEDEDNDGGDSDGSDNDGGDNDGGDNDGDDGGFQLHGNAPMLLSQFNQHKTCMSPLASIKELRLCINLNDTSGAVSVYNVFTECSSLQLLAIRIECFEATVDDDLPHPKEMFWEQIERCKGVEEKLKVVCIRNFTETELEIGLVRFLASRAKVLERLSVYHPRKLALSRDAGCMQMASQHATIEFLVEDQ